MPTTYNGIGTHYYGKKNLETHPGVCRQCGRSVNLSSYDTRLWFVVLFIPVIPLARKRILDRCPACTRHFVLVLEKWEAAKQLEISGALAKFRANPTPELAIQAHQQLINFHQSSQAAEFRQLMCQKFADNPQVYSYLGLVLTQLGQLDEAAPYFSRALELRSDLPEARIGVAHNLIRSQRPDEARKLLDFLEQPGAEQLHSLEPLEQLARAYQQLNRHTEALDLFNKLQLALPSLAEHRPFRKLVAISEKAMGRKDSILPKLKFSWKTLFTRQAQPKQLGTSPKVTRRGLAIAGAIAGLLAVGMLIANEYIRRHRTLYVVNGLGSPALIQISGLGNVNALRGMTEVVLAEGRHHAIISAPIRQEVDFDVHSDYFSRWFGDPAWVLNVSGAALLVYREAVYSKEGVPSRVSFHFGQPFEHFPRVTNPFRSLPDSVRVESHEEKRVLTQLDLFRDDRESVFYYFQGQGQSGEALRFAEWSLGFQPEDEQMLRLYAAAAQRQKQRDRAEKFLGAVLTNRPVRIEWHRMYQNLRKDGKRDERLAAMYDEMLRADPASSALLYLRGRLASTHAENREWFERARQADPRNPYPIYALGYDKIGIGDWAGARELLGKVVELRPKDSGFAYLLAEIRLALKEFGSLEQDYRNRLKREPVNYFAASQLCSVLLAQGRKSDAQQVVSGFERAATAQYKQNGRNLIDLLQRHWLYASGDFAGLEKQARTDRSPAGRTALFQALVEQGRIAEGIKVLQPPDLEEAEEPFHLLTIAIAFAAAGDSAQADQWRARAVKALAEGDLDYARSAKLLQRQTEPSQAELDDLVLPANLKAIVLAALAQQHSATRAELSAAARRFNVTRYYPYHLIQRVTAQPGDVRLEN